MTTIIDKLICTNAIVVRHYIPVRGIAINPRREDLIERMSGSDLPLRPIAEIKEEVEQIVGGKPEPARLTDNPVAVVKWTDGTVLDTVWQVDR